jgi:hypothetical protein
MGARFPVEPHRATTLSLSGAGADSVAWTIVRTAGTAGADATAAVVVASATAAGGAALTHTFAALGSYTASACVSAEADGSSEAPRFKRFKRGFNRIEADEASVQTIQVASSTSRDCASRALVCRYVRRELRELSPDDRAHFLDALKVMLDVPQRRGKHLYGADYKDMTCADSSFRFVFVFVFVSFRFVSSRSTSRARVRHGGDPSFLRQRLRRDRRVLMTSRDGTPSGTSSSSTSTARRRSRATRCTTASGSSPRTRRSPTPSRACSRRSTRRSLCRGAGPLV